MRDTFEKVLHLKDVLNYLNEEEYLRDHLLLKGGTAINLAVFNLPRLSVDIDMDYTPNDTKEEIVERIQLPPKFHFKMRYLDIDVDFVACFIVKPNKNEFVYNIMPENIEIVDMEDGSKLPCTSLEDWYIVYKLLRREEKAKLIKKYIYQKDANRVNERLELLIDNKENKLPKRVTKDVKDLIWDNMQLNLDDYFETKKEESNG